MGRNIPISVVGTLLRGVAQSELDGIHVLAIMHVGVGLCNVARLEKPMVATSGSETSPGMAVVVHTGYPANIPTRYWLTPSGVRMPTSEKTREIKSGLQKRL